MAGPDINNIKGLNVDEAVASGLAATQPVATTTRPNAPGIPPPEDPTGGFQSTLQVESPQWAGLPSQQDFGQVDVRRGNYNTGMVPTVNVQMPFAALANRQMALGQRKAALDKQVADFDLYSKVGSPDARYAQAFNKYATTQMDNWLRDYAMSMHGGDVRAATRDIASNPESARMWMNKSRELQAVADENKKWMSVAEERLAKHFSGEAEIKDPKALEAMMNYAASVDDNRVPVGADGKPLDAGDFVSTARRAVPEIQKVQYMEEVLGDSMKNAFKTMAGIDIDSRREGGNIVLRSQEVKSFDDAIKAYVDSDERWVKDFNGGDKQEAIRFIKAFYPVSVKDDIQMRGVNYAPQRSGGTGAQAPVGSLTVDYAPLPEDTFKVFNDKGKTMLSEGAAKSDFPYLPIFDEISGQGRTAQPRMFSSTDSGGKNIYMIPERIVNLNGKKFIFGKEAGEPGAAKESDRARGDRNEIQDFKSLKSVVVPYEGNEGRLNSYFPWLTPDAIEQTLGRASIRRDSKAAPKPASDPLGIL